MLSKKGESTQRHYRQMWRSHLEPNLGSLHVHELSAKRLEKFQADVTAGKSKRGTKTKRKHGGPVAANHSLNLLSGMCELAIRYDIISANPVSGVERNRNTPRDYLFSAAELRLIAASVAQETDQGVRVAFRLFMETPLRHANVAKAEWSEFVGLGTDDAVWTIPAHKMKAGKPYAIGISRDLGDLIVAYREECTVLSTRWLFPMGRGISGAQKTPMVDFSTPRDSFKSAWRRIRARALKMAGESAADYRALNSAGVHAFRHAFVSRAAEMDGVTAFDIQQLGSWADIKTGMGYIHAGAQRKNALASKVAGDVRALIREGEAMKLTEKVVSLIGPRTSAG